MKVVYRSKEGKMIEVDLGKINKGDNILDDIENSRVVLNIMWADDYKNTEQFYNFPPKKTPTL